MAVLQSGYCLMCVCVFLQSLAANCQQQVFFGNGLRNGWADQNSIVIWSRLTSQPEMSRNGKRFIPLASEDGREFKEVTDEKIIMQAQVPAGASLNDMVGACPGAEGDIRLTYFLAENPSQKTTIDWRAVNPKKNFTAQWKLENLKPGTSYQLLLEGRPTGESKASVSLKGLFRTAPAPTSASKVSFCVISCHDYRSIDDSLGGHTIYKTMGTLKPDFFVHTGDVEYYDRGVPMALTESLARFKWDRIFALPFNRQFFNETTSYFQKDDHDALIDDGYPGTRYGALTFERGIEIFDKEQFPSNDLPYKTIRWGKGLQIWLVEGRNFRSPNQQEDGPEKSIWGKAQKDWFFKTVAESDADFKILLSPTPILGPDRDNKFDNHANKNWQTEGEELRQFIDRQKNMFIICGDRHWQYVTHREGKNLWEFGTGGGSDKHAGGWPANDKRPEHRFLRVKGGFVKGIFDPISGTLTLTHHAVDGQEVHREIFNTTSK